MQEVANEYENQLITRAEAIQRARALAESSYKDFQTLEKEAYDATPEEAAKKYTIEPMEIYDGFISEWCLFYDDIGGNE